MYITVIGFPNTYAVDSAIQLLNNWGQMNGGGKLYFVVISFFLSFFNLTIIRYKECYTL